MSKIKVYRTYNIVVYSIIILYMHTTASVIQKMSNIFMLFNISFFVKTKIILLPQKFITFVM